MKISEKTITALAEILTGDSKMSPYRSGPQLVNFFNEFGVNDVYGSGFPTRRYYVADKLRAINGKHIMSEVVSSIVDPRSYINSGFEVEVALGHLNSYLKYDGFEIIKNGDLFQVLDSNGQVVDFKTPFAESKEINHVFIDQQIKKCDKKIREKDYDGAITNARSLVEAVLIEIEKNEAVSPPIYDGDLPKLFKRVRDRLKLDPARIDINNNLKQILTGLISVVNGLSSLRNKMGDAHAINYQPIKHHAKFAVNVAKTVCD